MRRYFAFIVVVVLASVARSAPSFPFDPHDSVAIALRAGRYRLAYRLIAAGKDSSDPGTRSIRRAIALIGIGDSGGADSVLSGTTVTGFEIPYRQYFQAEAWYGAGDTLRAAHRFDSLSVIGTPTVRDSSQVWTLRCGLALGDTALTDSALARLTARQDDLAAVGLLAEIRYDSARWRPAWHRLLDEFPGTLEALTGAALVDSLGWQPHGEETIRLAKLYVAHNEPDSAIVVWYMALSDSELASRRTEIRYHLADLLSKQRRYRDSEVQIKAILADTTAQSYWPETIRLYALLERRRERESRSRYWERQFITRYPKNPQAPDALWNIGMSWERSGRCDKAANVYRELQKRYPLSPEAEEGEWRIGFCAYLARRYNDAHRIFSRLARKSKNWVMVDQAGYWSGLSLYSQGHIRSAHDEWDRWAAYSPRSYYAVASASAADRPIVPPEDVEPLPPDTTHEPYTWPGYREARWLSSIGAWQWAREVLSRDTRGMATTIPKMEALANAFEDVADYPMAIRWRWRAMWRRTTEDQYHKLTPDLLRRIWPDFFHRDVMHAAERFDVDPALVWAIIRQESVFDPEVTSQANARGLMQIIPATGRVLAQQADVDSITPEDLYDPGLNIELGTLYLKQLLRRFGKIDLVAAAYNAGPANAARWQRTADGNHDILRETITYAETRHYVKLVLKNYLIYRSLYPESEREAEQYERNKGR